LFEEGIEMWSKRQASHTDKHPNPHALISAVIMDLIVRKAKGAWAHFELVSDHGWMKNLLFGKAPWMEIATDDFQTLQLNLGMREPQSSIPDKWEQEDKGMWLVPDTDITELADWMTNEFGRIIDKKDFRLTGWIEGL
jgi:hypothetical protein